MVLNCTKPHSGPLTGTGYSRACSCGTGGELPEESITGLPVGLPQALCLTSGCVSSPVKSQMSPTATSWGSLSFPPSALPFSSEHQSQLCYKAMNLCVCCLGGVTNTQLWCPGPQITHRPTLLVSSIPLPLGEETSLKEKLSFLRHVYLKQLKRNLDTQSCRDSLH